MKSLIVILSVMVFSFTSLGLAHAENGMTCGARISGGDAWPWSIAKPFPWSNIQGYWKLGDDPYSYLSAKVLSSTNSRKILSLSVHDDGVCSKPYAKGTGYIDISDKNVVRALVTDGIYKYQLKLGMFDSRDIVGLNTCSTNTNIVALSIQVIARVKTANDPIVGPLDPSVTQMRNMVLKKVPIDVDSACKRVH